MRIKQKSIGRLLMSMLWIGITIYGFYYVFDVVNKILGEEQVWTWPTLDQRNIALITLLLVLMSINWGVEALKWQLSIVDIEKQTFFRALKATFVGVAISTWMPNRLGEYLGKVFYVKPQNRSKSAISSLYVSYTQIIATLTFGLIGAAYFLIRYKFSHNVGVAATSMLFVLVVMIGALFYKKKIVGFLKVKNRNFRFFINTLIRYNAANAKIFVGLSAVRFTIFTIQFIISLYLFDVEGGFVELFLIISMIFGLQTVIPAGALAGLGIRGAMSVFFLGYLSSNTVGILSASYLLWTVNLLLPSFLGLLALLTSPVKKEVKEQLLVWVNSKTSRG